MLDRARRWLYTRGMTDSTVRHEYDGTVIVEIHHFYHQPEDSETTLTQLVVKQENVERVLSELVAQNIREERGMTVQLDALQQEVAAIPDVVQSVTTLLNGIEQRLAEVDAAEDAAVQAQIDAIRNDIHSNVRTLAEAVAARTPAAPETTGGPADTGTLGGGVGMGGGGTAQPPEQPATGTPSEPAPSGGGGSETGGSTGAPAGGTGEPGTAGEGTPPPA